MNRKEFGLCKRHWLAVVLCGAVLAACSEPGSAPPVSEAVPGSGLAVAPATVPEAAASAPAMPEEKQPEEESAGPLDLTLQSDPSEASGPEQTPGDAQKFQKKILPELFDNEPADRGLSVSGGLLHTPEYEMTQEEEGFVDSIKGAELTVTVKTR